MFSYIPQRDLETLGVLFRFRAGITVALLLGAALAPARAQEFAVLYHERPLELRVPAPMGGALGGLAAKTSAETEATASFLAFGQQFELQLVVNDQLFAGVDPALLEGLDDFTPYRGTVAGQAGSWVRLTQSHGQLRGLIKDGDELYVLDPYDRISAHLTTPDDRGPGTVIYRLRDVTRNWVDVALAPLASNDSEDSLAAAVLGGIAQKPLEPLITPGKQLNMGIVSDVEFFARYGDQSAAEILTLFNIVDGIFVEQVGIRLNIAELRQFQTESDPFSATTPVALLDQLANFKQAELPTMGIAHLFTGRTLGGSGGLNQTVGIANLGAVCHTRFGVSLTQATLGSAAGLVAAHELGHNFGAPHDAEPGSPCAATPDFFLMAPQISGGSDMFSECSRRQMLPKVLAASCLVGLLPSDLSVRVTVPPPSPVFMHDYVEASFAIDAPASSEAWGVLIVFNFEGVTYVSQHVEGASCGINVSVVYCYLHHIGAGQSVTGTMRARPHVAGMVNFGAFVSSINDPNPSNNVLEYSVQAQPVVDLAIELTQNNFPLAPGETRQLQVPIRNTSAAHATGVIAEIWAVQELEIVTIGPVPCTQPTNAWYQVCELGNLAAGQTKVLDLTLRASPDALSRQREIFGEVNFLSADVSVSVRAIERLGNLSNNNVRTTIVIAEDSADLSISIMGPAIFRSGALAAFTVTIENHGPSPAKHVQVTGWVNELHQNLMFSDSLGICAIHELFHSLFCELSEPMAPGDHFVIDVSGVLGPPSPMGGVAFSATSHTYDPVRENSQHVERSFSITETPPAGSGATGGGGGGSMGLAQLAALLLLGGLRRRRHAAPSRRQAAGGAPR